MITRRHGVAPARTGPDAATYPPIRNAGPLSIPGAWGPALEPINGSLSTIPRDVDSERQGRHGVSNPPLDWHARTDVAIAAAADALLTVCALQTGTDPHRSRARALAAINAVFEQAEREQ